MRLDRPTNRRAVPLLLILIACTLGSCARELPLAPVASQPARSAESPASGGNGGGGSNVEDEVVVTLVAGVTAEEVAADFSATVDEYDAALRTASLVPAVGQTPADLALALSLDRRVVTVEENDFLESTEARQQSFAFDDGQGTPQTFVEQPAAAALRLASAQGTSIGRDVVVACLDTGIDPTHPLFAGRLVPGWDFVGLDGTPAEETNALDDDNDGHVDEAFGHGTHVAGLVALTAPGARIMPIRVLDADGRGDVRGVAAGVRWATQHGAKVINLSLGMLHNSDGIQNALEEAELAGVVIVVSAGNWGSSDPEEFPARSSHANAVAASDAFARPAPFTSFADHVRICAPGVGVRSAFPGGGWRLWSGTSMSAPFVAGTAALLLAVHPTWTADQVFWRMSSTARPLQNVLPGQVGLLGSGMLDVGAALAPDASRGMDSPPSTEDILRRPR